MRMEAEIDTVEVQRETAFMHSDEPTAMARVSALRPGGMLEMYEMSEIQGDRAEATTIAATSTVMVAEIKAPTRDTRSLARAIAVPAKVASRQLLMEDTEEVHSIAPATAGMVLARMAEVVTVLAMVDTEAAPLLRRRTLPLRRPQAMVDMALPVIKLIRLPHRQRTGALLTEAPRREATASLTAQRLRQHQHHTAAMVVMEEHRRLSRATGLLVSRSTRIEVR